MTTIPVEALVLKGDQETVYSLDASNRVHIRNVEVGLRGSKLAEIKSGLEPGDRVILGAQENYIEGEQVSPILTQTPAFRCDARVRRGDRHESGAEENNGGAK